MNNGTEVSKRERSVLALGSQVPYPAIYETHGEAKKAVNKTNGQHHIFTLMSQL